MSLLLVKRSNCLVPSYVVTGRIINRFNKLVISVKYLICETLHNNQCKMCPEGASKAGMAEQILAQ